MMDILRFITAGNVDDGKSTLIGRLLYDTNNIKKDVLESVADTAQETSPINLAYITDGLREERQHGITIDVAYKYFTTSRRKYIIIDAPGHFGYTRNLVTGASGADLMIILIDAKNGIADQTKRHSLAASFLKTNQIVVAINKMDLVNYNEQVFNSLRKEYLLIAEKLHIPEITFIPMSALCGDNVSFPSLKMDWYKGKTLMQYLDSYTPLNTYSGVARFSIQYIIDAVEKGYTGKMLSGKLKAGEGIVIYPKAEKTEIRKIMHGYEEVTEAGAGQNVCIFLENDIDAKRGNIIAAADNGPTCSSEFEATVCWLNADAALQPGAKYYLRINGLETSCTITEVLYKIDVTTFEERKTDAPVEVNEFAKVKISTSDTIAYDLYAIVPENGRGIIIDAGTNYTSAAFII